MNNQNHFKTMTLASGVLSTGTTTTFTTGADVNAIINGAFATTYSAANNAASATAQGDGSAFVAQPGGADTGRTVGSASVYVFCVIAAGTVVVYQGSVEDLDEAGDIVIAPEFPSIPDTAAPFGYVFVEVDAANTVQTFPFTWATNVTETWTNCAWLPDRPVQA